ncbi:hypothetical protein ZHAS_00013791 [Anopheles sinensis]|uniref:Uncharacterized protein n=1 Tax=Anopheles sinensis TaxID=74873 RepID=A0A084W6G7_ANOSI|nr:hypothetical protein ZHAS_00013791 [Anopheles sinensis]
MYGCSAKAALMFACLMISLGLVYSWKFVNPEQRPDYKQLAVTTTHHVDGLILEFAKFVEKIQRLYERMRRSSEYNYSYRRMWFY